jgi:hypothetical protein
MPLKQDAGSDFAAVLRAASQTPEDFDSLGKDLPDGFPFPQEGRTKVIDTSEDGIPGVAAFDFKVHRKVFTIFRPWDSCARCGRAMAAGEEEPPATGDYECPHVLVEEYETVVNDILAGKLLFGSEQEITQKDGSVLVSLRWYEKIPSKKKKPQPRVDGTVEEPSL